MTAGAVSADMRELRPVEIVGLYEDVTESLEVRLSVSCMMVGRHAAMMILVFSVIDTIGMKDFIVNCVVSMAGGASHGQSGAPDMSIAAAQSGAGPSHKGTFAYLIKVSARSRLQEAPDRIYTGASSSNWA